MTEARYDGVVDFYVDRWTDDYDDPVTAALLAAAGPVDGLDVLDVACGHGRISRELARRGGRVVGLDLSGRLLARAEEVEAAAPLGVRYVHADAADPGDWLDAAGYDVATCCFGLSDIDDLDGALATVARALRPGGRPVSGVPRRQLYAHTVTSQLPDTVRYRDGEYVLTAVEGGPPFDPAAHGLAFRATSTACWRGHLCAYRIDGDHLLLEHLHV